jgi:hypothetical protein
MKREKGKGMRGQRCLIKSIMVISNCFTIGNVCLIKSVSLYLWRKSVVVLYDW